jgi:ribosomal protein S11
MLNIVYNSYNKIQLIQPLSAILYKKKNNCNIYWITITTKNNIFSMIYSKESKKLLTKSAGSIGIRKKKTSNIVYRYLIKLFSLFLNANNTWIHILFRKQITNRKKKTIISNILRTKLKVSNIYGLITTSHGGTKLRKKRRL